MLKVYGFARVNKVAHGNTRDLRVLWALEEIGLHYDIVGMDHPNHDLDSPAYRALNPFGQIPMIDDDGVVATDDFTVADILMTHVLGIGTAQELMKPYANILAYRARCTERPAWKKTLDAYRERVEAV